jgi:hypothetical protein
MENERDNGGSDILYVFTGRNLRVRCVRFEDGRNFYFLANGMVIDECSSSHPDLFIKTLKRPDLNIDEKSLIEISEILKDEPRPYEIT